VVGKDPKFGITHEELLLGACGHTLTLCFRVIEPRELKAVFDIVTGKPVPTTTFERLGPVAESLHLGGNDPGEFRKNVGPRRAFEYPVEYPYTATGDPVPCEDPLIELL